MDEEFAKEMYKEHILELNRKPINFGVLEGKTNTNRSFNSICGDDITMQLLVEGEIVKDAKFIGKGCAITVASACLVSSFVKGKSVDEIKRISSEEVISLLKIPVNLSRTKCALLPFESIKGALEKNE